MMGHERRIRLWDEIEREFGESVADVIMGLRTQGNSWRTVCGVLDVSLGTLQKWRIVLGLPMDRVVKVFDPSSLPEYSPANLKARALGYTGMREAVIDLRTKQGKTIKEAAQVLGVHWQTVSDYTPEEIRGTYNRSDYWWKQRRQWAKDMLARFKAKREKNKKWHPFNQENEKMMSGGYSARRYE